MLVGFLCLEARVICEKKTTNNKLPFDIDSFPVTGMGGIFVAPAKILHNHSGK
jgi:hypothetical protein